MLKKTGLLKNYLDIIQDQITKKKKEEEEGRATNFSFFLTNKQS